MCNVLYISGFFYALCLIMLRILFLRKGTKSWLRLHNLRLWPGPPKARSDLGEKRFWFPFLTTPSPPPNPERAEQSLYSKSERLPLFCRVTCALCERVNLHK